MLLPCTLSMGNKFLHQQFPFICGTPEMFSQASSTPWALLFYLSNKTGPGVNDWISFITKRVLLASKKKCFTPVHIPSCLEEFPLSLPIWLNFKDPGLQTTEEPSNVDEFQSWPAKGTLEAATSGWNVQYPLTKPLRFPVILMDFFLCCLNINSAY